MLPVGESMDEQLSREFRRFWDRFFELRHWKHRHLASLLGVSEDVVSKWVNGRNAISPHHLSELLGSGSVSDNEEIGQIVRLSLRALGFSDPGMHHLGVGLVGLREPVAQLDHDPGTTPSILVLTPVRGTSPGFYSGLLKEITDRSHRTDLSLLVHPIYDRLAKARLRDLYADLRSLRGVIAVNCHVGNSTWIEECQSSSVRLVLVHDNLEPERYEHLGHVTALWEDLRGLDDCVDHLVREHECKGIRIVMPDPTHHFQRQRKLSAIEARVKAHGVAFDRDAHVHVVAGHGYSEGREAAETIARTDDEADAVICLSDEVGLAVWQEAQRRGRLLRVTGFDNVPLAEHFDLTTVDHNRRLTADRALLQLRPDARFGTIQVPTTFIPRASCCGR